MTIGKYFYVILCLLVDNHFLYILMMYIFYVSRILFGGYFVYSAFNHLFREKSFSAYAASKGVPMPRLAVAISSILLFLGGAGILIGLYVPFAVAALVIFLIPATFIMHDFWKATDQTTRAIQQTIFAKNLALLGGALAFLFI